MSVQDALEVSYQPQVRNSFKMSVCLSEGTNLSLTVVMLMQANGNLDSLYAEHVDGILRISMRKKDVARR